jgi:hypothetical protein
MSALIALALVAAVLVWFMAPGRRQRSVAPEDDVETPIDQDELAEAERELREDEGARPLHDGRDEDDDDWGPGTR